MSHLDYSNILENMGDAEREALMAQVFGKLQDVQKAENSYYEFVKQAWPQIEGQPFQDNWHIQAICEHLEAAFRRDFLKLVLNVPPRHTKSTLVSVMFPAWVFIHAPHERFLYASHTSSISLRDSVACRRLIMTPWYQERWGHKFSLMGDQNTKGRFNNDKGGYRIATSVGANITGDGGTIRILDDPNDTSERSETVLNSTLDWFTGTWSQRRNNPHSDVMIVMQQRTNESDVSGYIIANDTQNEWVKLILPAEYEGDRRCKTVVLPSTNGKVWEDPRTQEGELLWPSFWTEKKLDEQKRWFNDEYKVAGQLQQRPAPVGGGYIKKDWFNIWKEEVPPHLEYVIQSWDTAFSGKKLSDFSACVTMGVFYDEFRIPNVILLNAWREKMDYPDLRKIAQAFYKDYRSKGIGTVEPDGEHVPDMVLIEERSSGHSLVQDFRRAGVPAIGFDPRPHGDKTDRVKKIAHLIQAGRVWVAAFPPTYAHLRRSAQLLVDCCTMFPAGKSRDLVDAMSQILIRLNLSGWIYNPSDEALGDTSMRMKKIFY